jgi:hypothetical protein
LHLRRHDRAVKDAKDGREGKRSGLGEFRDFFDSATLSVPKDPTRSK